MAVSDQAGNTDAASSLPPPPPPQPYEESSQFRHWKFTSEELQHLRQHVNEDGVARVLEAHREQQRLTDPDGTAEQPDCLTWEEQLTYCRFYEGRISDYCKKLGLDRFVQATALAYFRRFYLRNTVMDYDPKYYLMTCVFLSTKTENQSMRLEKFLANIPKSPSADMMIDLEFSLSKGIRFEYMVHHPFWPLNGFLLDIQSYIQSTHPGPAHQHFFEKLQQCYSRAEQFASVATLTDLTFTHMPSQIGLGCLIAAARERDFEQEIDRYLASRFHEKLDDLANLRCALDEVVVSVTAQASQTVSKTAAAAIHEKLQRCQNPEFDTTSALYKYRRAEEEKEQGARAAAKAQLQRSRSDDGDFLL
ncbi:hypothetical protein HKX48_008139 [Thoreauomyces humboldtii]|nr:hypothetical protein HKX48_008139 [Thoreauomyces humboldtii]